MRAQRADAVWAAVYVAKLMSREPIDVGQGYDWHAWRVANAADTADTVLAELEREMEERDHRAHRAIEPVL